MGARRILVTDLDGTLLGDDDALDRFASWYATSEDRYRLVYATGRSLGELRALIARTRLPEPDAQSVSVGTELYDRAGSPWPGWSERFEGWDAARARRALAGIGWLRPQDAGAQTRLKASFTAPGLTADELDLLRAALEAAGLEATLVYSSSLYLDVLAPGSGKGESAAVLARAWGARDRDVLVFGDSGNDLQMFQRGFRGTVVANALSELTRAVGPGTYRSPHPFADGVLDGIRHWSRRADA
ncbi:MAG TPA: HAD-IIB family hydrolase [Candidatus Limnocylindrales bacterium]|nr:HAD-IIB family hydrolase [Candidatus Limnocylindrales bacterium]